jgi:hypothetical protein
MPSQVDALGDALSRELNALAQALVKCQALGKVTPQDSADFENLKASCNDWLNRADKDFVQGQALQNELKPWHAKIAAYGCEVPADVFVPPSAPTTAPTNPLEAAAAAVPNMLSDLKWVAIAFVVWKLFGEKRR